MNYLEPGGERGVAAVMAELLEVSDVHLLGRSLIKRTLLDRGRFEAYEFGRNEHSSASAGAVVMGFSGTPFLSDQDVLPLIDSALGLIDDNGIVRGHDRRPAEVDSSWALGQVLLGLATRPHLLATKQKANVLTQRLLGAQDVQSFGWGFREGEPARPIFTFYPTLALCAAMRAGWARDNTVATRALNGAFEFLSIEAADPRTPLIEQLLASKAALSIAKYLQVADDSLRNLRADLVSSMDRSATPPNDLTVVLVSQPLWHARIWSPLLLLALPESSPNSPTKARLGQLLIDNFQRDTQSWLGPQTESNRAGVSWASAMAFRACASLAKDLSTEGVSVLDWKERIAALDKQEYDFDVAISFGGPDREVAYAVADGLKRRGLRVFYDYDFQHQLVGEDLTQYLQDTYFRRSRYAVIIVSDSFLRSKWASNWEWRAVLARMCSQSAAYVLPYVLDNTTVPGLNPTIGYVSADKASPDEFAHLVTRKVLET